MGGQQGLDLPEHASSHLACAPGSGDVFCPGRGRQWGRWGLRGTQRGVRGQLDACKLSRLGQKVPKMGIALKVLGQGQQIKNIPLGPAVCRKADEVVLGHRQIPRGIALRMPW